MSKQENSTPEAAVEAAMETLHESWRDYASSDQWLEIMRDALEAAAPIMLSHERQQSADAHRDAMVNRNTADLLQDQLESCRHALEAAAPRVFWSPGLDEGIHESNTVDPFVEAVAKALHERECVWNDWAAIHPRGGSYVVKARVALEAAAMKAAK